MDAIDRETVEGLKVETFYDQDAESPRDWDNLGRFAGRSKCQSTMYDEELREDAGSAYRHARQDHGPLLALPIRGWDTPLGTSVQVEDWDDADGIYYVPLSKLEEEYGAVGAESLSSARRCLVAELETYTQWAQGDVYGYVISLPTGEQVDSLWGIFGSEYALQEARDAARAIAADTPEWVRAQIAAWSDEDEDAG